MKILVKVYAMMVSLMLMLIMVAPVNAGGLAGPIVEPTVGVPVSIHESTGLTKRALCSNVPARNGAVPGFLVVGVGWFVSEPVASYAAVDAFVIPADVDVKDAGEVRDYLISIGLDDVEFPVKREERSWEVEVGATSSISYEIVRTKHGYRCVVVRGPTVIITDTVTSSRDTEWC